MAIRNGQITAGSTAMSLTITGGSAITLVPTSAGANSVELAVSSDSDVRTRRRVKVQTVDAKPSASMPSGYTMSKGTLDLIIPKTLANGKTEYAKYTVVKNSSVENTIDEITEHRRLLAQLVLASVSDEFWNLNSNQ